MIQKINKTEKILNKLRKDSKSKTIEWNAEQWEIWNNLMEEIHRDCVYKQKMSEISASNCWLY